MPGVFDHIFGQDSAIDSLRRAWAAGRLPHGIIFAGPVGVGKATSARALGKLFLCEQPCGDAACGQCQSCAHFQHDSHPDFHVVTKEMIRYHDVGGKSKGITLSIEVVRHEVIEPAGLKPGLGHGKVFVIEQAELMARPAQNALLKTLEEPPGRTLLVLLTGQPHRLLATVRSRCRLLTFGPLPQDRVREQLVSLGHDPQTATAAARVAGGSLGLAIRWIEDSVVESARELMRQLQQVRGGKPAGQLPAWLRQAAEAYAEKQLDRDPLGSKDQARREGLSLYLQFAGQLFQHVMRSADQAEELERCCAAIEALRRAEELLQANVTVSLALQQLAVTLAQIYRRPAA